MRPLSALWAFGLLGSLARGKNTYDTRFDATTWDDERWRLRTASLDQGHYQSRMSLANGYLGINLAAVGPFFEVDTPVDGDDIEGWPLFNRRQSFATIAGFYDYQPTTNGSNFPWLYQYGGESVISGIPHWAGLLLKVGDDVLDARVSASQISNFSSTLDMKVGVLTWNFTWTPEHAKGIDVEYTMFVHKKYVNRAAVQLRAKSSEDLDVTVIDVLDGDCAVRSTPTEQYFNEKQPVIYSAVNPRGISNVTAYVYSTLSGTDECHWNRRWNFKDESIIGGNESSIAQAMTMSLRAELPGTVTKYIGAASNDAFDDPQGVARDASCSGAQTGFDDLLSTHSEEWRAILTEESVDDYRYPNGTIPNDPNIVDLQITAITNPFQLLQNTVSSNAIKAAGNNTKLDVNSISVCGLYSDCYAGMIFWDADVWMSPGLVVSHPHAAKQIARYRVEKYPQAQANIETAYQSSQNETKFSKHGAVYPWTSGRFGNCTATGPCFDYEYHINGDIGLELYNFLAVTGDTEFFSEQFFPIYDSVAEFYSNLVSYNESDGRYFLRNATDPDEYANHVDDPGYTDTLIKTHLDTANDLRQRMGMVQIDAWNNISSLMEIPVDQNADIIKEYETMNNTISVKQADVILVDDFLDYPNPYTNNDLDYYAGKQSPDGPAMTYGVFSVVANRFSPSGCSSYTYDLYGTQPYIRGPWYQFSEQLIDNYNENGGTHPAYPFLTGVGGAHRVAIFGYLGLRLMLDSVNIDPSLPPQIPYLNYRTIYWQGWPLNATSNQTHTTLTRLPTPLENANVTFVDHPIPVTIGLATNSTKSPHLLHPNTTLTLPNRQIGDQKTLPGNLAQCRPIIYTSQPYQKGQFPLSAIDGAVSTKWSPQSSNVLASIVVSLPWEETGFVPVSGLKFDWAQAPPRMWKVEFSNSSTVFRTGNSSSLSSSSSSAAKGTGRKGDDDSEAVVLVAQSGAEGVQISDPYDPSTAAEIRLYSSNTTNVTLEGTAVVWSGKFAVLTIEGNQGLVDGSGSGASVAEWGIIGPEGRDVVTGR
ncbi:glycoside hydrolase family 65 protein [Hortaea werneckii]|nr:glycoside hydrolase family 65 protein [Hortaea werneckii]KAI7108415.1 glycoside hydrolase family 65 protein [Hortaea werneckii]KAI7305097.1 glycoside hydrolase family 65 protein [Hortaea werneckii]KAI7395066.1 glycoside hydrolase family 65 protein [Hortaea werneckii]